MPWPKKSRVREAARIRESKPWLKSTGPRTTTGKARTCRNADKGLWTSQIRGIAKLLRQMEDSIREHADS